MGFGRANDIVTSYHNLSYSLNWSAVDRGTSRRPTANFRLLCRLRCDLCDRYEIMIVEMYRAVTVIETISK